MSAITLSGAKEIVTARERRILAPGGIEWALSNPPSAEFYRDQRVLAKAYLQRQAALDERVREGSIPGADLRR